MQKGIFCRPLFTVEEHAHFLAGQVTKLGSVVRNGTHHHFRIVPETFNLKEREQLIVGTFSVKLNLAMLIGRPKGFHRRRANEYVVSI